jgi:hypothetical protein
MAAALKQALGPTQAAYAQPTAVTLSRQRLLQLTSTPAKFEIRGDQENTGAPEFCINICRKIVLMVSLLAIIEAAEQRKRRQEINWVLFIWRKRFNLFLPSFSASQTTKGELSQLLLIESSWLGSDGALFAIA